MLGEIVRRHGIAPQGLIARIKKHPELLDHPTSRRADPSSANYD